MSHVLITGATGLLGRYLLRDLLSAGIEVAVIVRPGRKQNAAQRVDALMNTWESMLERELPRPHVLEGDLCSDLLGLSRDDRDWIGGNCDLLIHNAASLTFKSGGPDGEPWRSNVEGTRRVLDLCRNTGIRDFHHMSTSYVCGLRSGLIRESELNVGQRLGNDYEKSKVQAETMVREADFLSPPTFYRPAIIVGDSITGFTTTFHGFYATLHLAYTLRKFLDADMGRDPNEVTRLTLDGTERKNLVPVDWVSAVVTHIISNRQFHGETYHLTPRQPVTASDIRYVLEEAYGSRGTVFHGAGMELDNPTEVERLFYEQLQVYSSYWRDDPEFDTTNTCRAAPHLPCPTMDRELLLMMARKAIEMRFRFKDTKPAAKSAGARSLASKT